MKILVIGSGGREHALAHTFFLQGHRVYCHPGNPGIRAIASPLFKESEQVSIDDHAAIARGVCEEKIDLTVVGPEVPLEKGIQDFFTSQKLPLFGPTKRGARLETSKAWAKQFMLRHQIPTAEFTVCRNSREARLAALALFAQGKGAVIKPSGLTGGKGIVCCQNYEEAAQTIRKVMEEKCYGLSGAEVVVEELLSGPEISFQVLSDGKSMIPLIAAQDHKRVYEKDEGPNTGGMGAYAPLPFLDKETQQKIEHTLVLPTLLGLQGEQIDYRGVLYFGIMLTSEGPKLLEYNCRFGDPEAQTILPLLETDLAEAMIGCIQGEIDKVAIRWKPLSSCCVVLTSRGYPSSFSTGDRIEGLEMFAQRDDLLLFHAGTAQGKKGELITAGGRVIGVTGLGGNLDQAIATVYDAIRRLSPAWAHFRNDIGSYRDAATV